MRARAVVILFFNLIFLNTYTCCQEYLFEGELISKEEGLAHLASTSIFQDSRGLIWIGTYNGLNLYDGDRFELFTKEKHGLHNNFSINRIIEDENGNLWLFYAITFETYFNYWEIQAIDIFNPNTKEVVPFEDYFPNAPFEVKDLILPRIIDSQHNLWLTTNQGELFSYQQGTFKPIFKSEYPVLEFLTITSEQDIWLGTQKELTKIDQSGNILDKIILPNSMGNMKGIWSGNNGVVWVAALQKEDTIQIWEKVPNSPFKPLVFTKEGKELSPKIQNYNNFFLHLDQNGYWYVQIDQQIHLFDQAGEWIYSFSDLIGNDIFTNYRNYFKSKDYLWLNTDIGVVKLSFKKNNFEIIRNETKQGSDCRGIVEDAKNNIYFINRDIYRWDSISQVSKKILKYHSAGRMIFLDSVLFAGDYTSFMLGYKFDLKTQELIEYCLPKTDIQKSVYAPLAYLKTEISHLLLVGTTRGLIYADLQADSLVPFKRYNEFEELKDLEVNFLHKNVDGIWLATNNGLYRMLEGIGVINHYHSDSKNLPFNNIRHIHEDKDGIFWLATKGGGMIKWEPPRDENEKINVTQFTTSDGLSHNNTYAIYEDEDERLWIPSDKGLMLIDKQSLEIRTFLPEDGLPHQEFNHTSHFQAENGTLYMGGLGGVIRFHPREFSFQGSNKIPLTFTEYHILQKDSTKLINRTELLNTGSISITPDDKFFELRFKLLDYADPDKHLYAYRIKGYDDNWQYINESFIRITSLPYGKYTLEIKGKNIKEGWSQQQLSLELRILRPFYLQWWFIILGMLFLTGAIIAILRWRIRKLDFDKRYLESEIKKRTLQIQQDKELIASQADELKQLDNLKTRFFSNITHEFRTPLTLIIGPLEQVINQQPPPNILRRKMRGMFKNAQHLLVLTNQLLDLAKIGNNQMSVTISIGDIISYTQELASRFQPLIDKKKLQLSFVSNLDRWETHFDQNKWDKIVYNLLSNAIKFTDAHGVIQLSRDSASNLCKLYVLDIERIKKVVKKYFSS